MREFPWILLSLIEVVVGDRTAIYLVLQGILLIMSYRVSRRFEFLTVVHDLTIVEALLYIFVCEYFFEIQGILRLPHRLL